MAPRHVPPLVPVLGLPVPTAVGAPQGKGRAQRGVQEVEAEQVKGCTCTKGYTFCLCKKMRAAPLTLDKSFDHPVSGNSFSRGRGEDDMAVSNL